MFSFTTSAVVIGAPNVRHILALRMRCQFKQTLLLILCIPEEFLETKEVVSGKPYEHSGAGL